MVLTVVAPWAGQTASIDQGVKRGLPEINTLLGRAHEVVTVMWKNQRDQPY